MLARQRQQQSAGALGEMPPAGGGHHVIAEVAVIHVDRFARSDTQRNAAQVTEGGAADGPDVFPAQPHPEMVLSDAMSNWVRRLVAERRGCEKRHHLLARSARF